MNDYQIHNFLTVIEKRSISAAAQSLFISPQALHQQLGSMEQELGFKLLKRSNKGVALTEAGQIFYDGAARIAANYRSILAAARAAANVESNTITLLHQGVFTDILYSQAIYEFWRINPEVKLLLATMKPELLASADILLNDSVDGNDFTEAHTIYRTQLYAVVGPEHPLLNCRTVDWMDLFQYDIKIHSPKLLAHILPAFWEELSLHKWTEYRPEEATVMGTYQMNRREVIIFYDIPVQTVPLCTTRPIQNTEYDVQLLTRKTVRPVVRQYLDFIVEYHRRHWDEVSQEYLKKILG